MNKNVNYATQQNRNLIKNTIFTVGSNPEPIVYERLLSILSTDPLFIFSIVENGLHVILPLGFVTTSEDSEEALEYYQPVEQKASPFVYKGMLSNSVLTLQQCLQLNDTTPVYNEMQDYYLTSYFTTPIENDRQTPYTIEDSSIIFNLPTYILDKVTFKKGHLPTGTSLPLDFLDDCELFDTEVERDEAYDRYRDEVKGNLFKKLFVKKQK